MPDQPIVFVVVDDDGIRDWLQALLEDADYACGASPAAMPSSMPIATPSRVA
jgi:hypothetical protein